MKLSEIEREKIASKLNSDKHGLWKDLKSELHGMGAQALFFFLIEDPRAISKIVTLFQTIAANDLSRIRETEFELSFIEIRVNKKIVWDVIDNDEIRGNFPPRTWGGYPQQFDLGEDELFTEYVAR